MEQVTAHNYEPTRDRFDRAAWITAALRLVPKDYHRLISPQFHVLMDRIQDEHDRATVSELADRTDPIADAVFIGDNKVGLKPATPMQGTRRCLHQWMITEWEYMQYKDGEPVRMPSSGLGNYVQGKRARKVTCPNCYITLPI